MHILRLYTHLASIFFYRLALGSKFLKITIFSPEHGGGWGPGVVECQNNPQPVELGIEANLLWYRQLVAAVLHPHGHEASTT